MPRSSPSLSWFGKASTLFVLALICGATSRADDSTGSIYGWVYASGTVRTPVCPLVVRLRSEREPDWQTTTRNGWFTFLSVRPGDVSVDAGGLETREAVVHANLPTQVILYVRASSHDCGRRS